MPSRAVAALLHIKDNIQLARRFTGELDEASFEADRQVIYAVTRCLEIISEATRRLPDDLLKRHPEIPWRNIRDAGNVYRHHYEGVAERFVWATVRDALPQLEAVIDAELARGGS